MAIFDMRSRELVAPDSTPFRRIRMPDEMWDQFAKAVTQAEPELDRSKVIREFVRWYIGETNDLPRRPVDQEKRGD